jgi:hypothetical protein
MFLGGKARPAHKADHLTAISEPIISKMWDPQRLTILQASTSCYWYSFTFIQVFQKRALQWYSKCYCVTSVTKPFKLNGIQTIHRSFMYSFKFKTFRNTRHSVNIWNTTVTLLLKHPALPVEVTLNQNHPT